MFEKIGDIKTWLSLFAFIGALIVTYFLRKNLSDKKQIEAIPENQRGRLIEATAEKLKLDLNLIPKNGRTKIIQQALKNRIYQQIILAVTLLLAGCIIAYITIASNRSIEPEKPQIDSNAVKKDSSLIRNDPGTVRKDSIPPPEPVRPRIESEIKTYLNQSLLYQFDNIRYGGPIFKYFPMRSVEGGFIICDRIYNLGTVAIHPEENIIGNVTFRIPPGAKSFYAIAGLVKDLARPDFIGEVSFTIRSISKSGNSLQIADGYISGFCDQKELKLEITENLEYLKIEINPKGTNNSDHFALVNAYFSNREISK